MCQCMKTVTSMATEFDSNLYCFTHILHLVRQWPRCSQETSSGSLDVEKKQKPPKQKRHESANGKSNAASICRLLLLLFDLLLLLLQAFMAARAQPLRGSLLRKGCSNTSPRGLPIDKRLGLKHSVLHKIITI